MTRALMTLAFLGFLAVPAFAHGEQVPCNAYYIMQKCNADGTGCRAHMHYAPGHGLEDRPANYWYRKTHRWHYHAMFGHAHKKRYVETASGTVKIKTYKRVCVPHHHN